MPYQKTQKIGLKYLKDTKAFILYSNNMQNIYKSIEEYKPNRKCHVLMVFGDI